MRMRTALIIDPRGELRAAAMPGLERFGIVVVGLVGYGRDALESAYLRKPDLIIMRVAAPAARPLQVIERLHDALPDSPILAVIDEPDSGIGSRVTAAGGSACLDEPLGPDVLTSAIRAACERFERRQQDVRVVAGRGGHIITVLGSKGGVGKTTVATNLAIALEQTSRGSVALVDADLFFGDVALSMDLDVDRSLADFVANLGELETRDIPAFMTGKFGVAVLPAAASLSNAGHVTGADLLQVLDRVRHSFDFVVVDTGGALTDLTVAAADGASTRILVTTPDLYSVHDAAHNLRWLRQRLGQPAEQIQLLQNRVGMPGGLSGDAVDRELGQTTAWCIEDDTKLLKAMQVGVPVVARYPQSRAAVAIRRLASSFTRPDSGLDQAPPRRERQAFGRVAIGRERAASRWGGS